MLLTFGEYINKRAAEATWCGALIPATSEGAWINSALDELCFFPNGKHDDQVDSLSGGLAMLSERKRKILVRLKQMFADYSDLTEEQRDLLDELLARNQAGRFALLGMPPYEC